MDSVVARTAGTPAGGSSGRRSIFAHGSSGFRAEFDAYLHERLRLCTACLAISSLVLYVAARSLNLALGAGAGADFLHPSSMTHLAMTAAYVGLWLMLRRRALSGFGVRVMDGLLVECTIAGCVIVYWNSYAVGAEQLVPIIALLLVARATLVPSTARRTILLSAPACAAILGVHLAKGHGTAYGGAMLTDAAFAKLVVWDQIVLALAVAVAAITSRISFALRLTAYEAKQIERYTLEEKIGEGGMGEVYRARHGLLRRPTAIKLLRPEIAGERSIKRFEYEVQQTARLAHPNTIAIYDYGQTNDGLFYYAMELVDGADLDRIVEATGPMPAARAIHVLAQACAALHEAHTAGLVHRDVKPANILLCRRAGEFDVVKVMDFGLVRDIASDAGSTVAGEVTGTPHTMAPETIRGRPPTPAVDVYALGVVGCYLLTGRPIFDATGAGEFLSAHLNEPPIPPSARVPGVPADLERVLLDCLEKDPARRPSGTDRLRRSLLSCAAATDWDEDAAAAWWADNAPKLRSA